MGFLYSFLVHLLEILFWRSRFMKSNPIQEDAWISVSIKKKKNGTFGT